MLLDINIDLDHGIRGPVNLILQIQAPKFADQRVLQDALDFSNPDQVARVSGEAGMGERILIRTSRDLRCNDAV